MRNGFDGLAGIVRNYLLKDPVSGDVFIFLNKSRTQIPLIQPLFAVHRLFVSSEIYQQIDESPIKVQDREKPEGLHQGYMRVRTLH